MGAWVLTRRRWYCHWWTLKARPLPSAKSPRSPAKATGGLRRRLTEHFRPYLITAIYTGARKSEITRLRWSDINFERGKLALYRPKTGTADLLDLHPAIAAELTRLRDSRDDVQPDDHVFLSRHGTPYKEIRRSWALAVKAAGLDGRKGLTPHSLRHSFATHFLQNGGAVTDLQQQLGHTEPATTQIYASALSERRRDAVLALDFAPVSEPASAD